MYSKLQSLVKDQMSGYQLVRGLHIDPAIARQIDSAIDDLLREPTKYTKEVAVTPLSSDDSEGETETRVMKYFEALTDRTTTCRTAFRSSPSSHPLHQLPRIRFHA